MSAGEVGGGPSEKSDWRGVAAEEARAREKLCFREENPLEVEVDRPAGDAGRPLGLGGVGGIRAVAARVAGAFFFPVKERRNDHSDSN